MGNPEADPCTWVHGKRSGKDRKQPKSEPVKIFRNQRAELGPASSLRQSAQPRRLRGCCPGRRPPAPQPPGAAPAGFGRQQARPGAPGPEGGCAADWASARAFEAWIPKARASGYGSFPGNLACSATKGSPGGQPALSPLRKRPGHVAQDVRFNSFCRPCSLAVFGPVVIPERVLKRAQRSSLSEPGPGSLFLGGLPSALKASLGGCN